MFSPEPTLSETGSPWQAIVESSHIRGLGPKPPLKDYISWVDTSIKAPAVGSATGVITGFNKVEVLVRSSDGSQFEPAKEVYLHHAIMYQSRNAVTVMLNHKRERLDSLLDLCNSHFLMRTGNDGNVPLDYPRGTGSYVEGYQALRFQGMVLDFTGIPLHLRQACVTVTPAGLSPRPRHTGSAKCVTGLPRRELFIRANVTWHFESTPSLRHIAMATWQPTQPVANDLPLPFCRPTYDVPAAPAQERPCTGGTGGTCEHITRAGWESFPDDVPVLMWRCHLHPGGKWVRVEVDGQLACSCRTHYRVAGDASSMSTSFDRVCDDPIVLRRGQRVELSAAYGNPEAVKLAMAYVVPAIEPAGREVVRGEPAVQAMKPAAAPRNLSISAQSSAMPSENVSPFRDNLIRDCGCRRLAFVHIPKTGGSSVISAVRKNDVSRALAFPAPQPDPYRYHHVTAEGQRRYYGATEWDAALSVGVVRNPFTWVVSFVAYARAELCKSYKGNAFAAVVCNAPNIRAALEGIFTEANLQSGTWKQYFLRIQAVVQSQQQTGREASPTQSAWLKDSQTGETIVDWVVHLEDEQSFGEIAGNPSPVLQEQLCPKQKWMRKKAGWCQNVLTRAFSPGTVLHVRASKHSKPLDYYSPTTCALVAQAYSADFRQFGYNASECTAYVTRHR